MSSIDATINAGIAALRTNRQTVVNIAKQLADHASMSEDPTNVEIGGQLSAIASRLGAQPTGPASASGSGGPPPPPPGRYPPAGPQPGFRGLPPRPPQPQAPPGPSPKALKGLETSLKDIFAAGDSALMLPGQTRFDMAPSAPRNPVRLQAWNALLGLQRAAIATRNLTQPKDQLTDRNPGTNANFVKEVQKFIEARRQYTLKYAGVRDDPEPEPYVGEVVDGNTDPHNPFGPTGRAREEARTADLEEETARRVVGAAVAANRRTAIAKAEAKEAAAKAAINSTTRKRVALAGQLQAAEAKTAQESVNMQHAINNARANEAGFNSIEHARNEAERLQAIRSYLDTTPEPNLKGLNAQIFKHKKKFEKGTEARAAYDELSAEVLDRLTPVRNIAAIKQAIRTNNEARRAGFKSVEDGLSAADELDAFITRFRTDRNPNWPIIQTDFAKLEPRYRNTMFSDMYDEIKAEIDEQVPQKETAALTPFNALHAARTGALAGVQPAARPAPALPVAAPVVAAPATLQTLGAARAARLAGPPPPPPVDQSYVMAPSAFPGPASSSGRTPAQFAENAQRNLARQREAAAAAEVTRLQGQAMAASRAAAARGAAARAAAGPPLPPAAVPSLPPRRGTTLSFVPGSPANLANRAAEANGNVTNTRKKSLFSGIKKGVRGLANRVTQGLRRKPPAQPSIFADFPAESRPEINVNRLFRESGYNPNANARATAKRDKNNQNTITRRNKLIAALPENQRHLVKSGKTADGSETTQVNGAAANFLATRPNLQGGRRTIKKKKRSV